jgi:hypothetical protein
MGIVWAILIVAAIFAIAAVLAGRRAARRQAPYIGSPTWAEAQWLADHERAKAAEEHQREDHL